MQNQNHVKSVISMALSRYAHIINILFILINLHMAHVYNQYLWYLLKYTW